MATEDGRPAKRLKADEPTKDDKDTKEVKFQANKEQLSFQMSVLANAIMLSNRATNEIEKLQQVSYAGFQKKKKN